MVAQNKAVAALRDALDAFHLDDRRSHPSHGYRAVHVIASSFAKPIEVQVRTVLQHIWAELSEKYSDVVDPGIKYGGGPEDVRVILSQSSELVAMLEQMEVDPGRTSLDAVDVLRQRMRGLMQAEIDNLRDASRSGR
jgi:ppGpp synthetase/RelA/SpoT-type nucleotidyltranferase